MVLSEEGEFSLDFCPVPCDQPMKASRGAVFQTGAKKPSMETTARNRRLEPYYKRHATMDDARDVVLDVAVTAGEENEGETIKAQLEEVRRIAAREIRTATADTGYAYSKVFGDLERRGMQPRPRVPFPMRCQARHSQVPARQDPEPAAAPQSWLFLLLQGQGLRGLSAQKQLSAEGARQRGGGQRRRVPAPLRARCRCTRWSDNDQRLYQRRRGRSEVSHNEARTWHGLRAVPSGAALTP